MLPPEPLEELFELQKAGVPIAVIDPRVPINEGIPCVAATNAAGADAATEHLLELGHRSIGIVTRPPGWAATEERRQGHHAALARAGLQPEKHLAEVGELLLRLLERKRIEALRVDLATRMIEGESTGPARAA